MSSDYSHKLRDPRWQKKRLEIMQRDEFVCQKCFSSEATLNVHHCYYETGFDPWDYPSASVITLCEFCHSDEDSYADRKQSLIKAFGNLGFLSEDIIDLAGSLSTIKQDHPRDIFFISALCHWLSSADHRDAMVDVYFRELRAKNRKHPGGGPTADGLEISATGRDSCESGTAERKDEAGMVA